MSKIVDRFIEFLTGEKFPDEENVPALSKDKAPVSFFEKPLVNLRYAFTKENQKRGDDQRRTAEPKASSVPPDRSFTNTRTP